MPILDPNPSDIQVHEDITSAMFFKVDNKTGLRQPWDVSREQLRNINHSTHNGFAFTVKREYNGHQLMDTCLLSPLHGLIVGESIGKVLLLITEEAMFSDGSATINESSVEIDINHQGMPSPYTIVDMVFMAVAGNTGWMLDCNDIDKLEDPENIILMESEQNRQDNALQGNEGDAVN